MLGSKNTHREAGLADNKEMDTQSERQRLPGRMRVHDEQTERARIQGSNRRAKIFSNKVGG
jgi:hypothetical protein